MAEELTEIMGNFALSSKEKAGTQLEVGDVREGILECQSCLIGKIRGEKVNNFTGVKNLQ